jgi:anti-sigma factor (TIGR02949 family)
VQCAESLRVQAYFDAEVDAVAAAEIERHIERCAECRALLENLQEVRRVLRRDTAYETTPIDLRARLTQALDRESAAANVVPITSSKSAASRLRRAPFWSGAISGFGGAAIAAMLAFFLVVPRFSNPLVDDLVSAHLRSLMPAHLIDVVSTDKHTVKPWFAGHTDVSPTVADYTPQGYQLIGGRADYLEHQRSAVVVYQHGAHVINVFSWADGSKALPSDTTRNGYHMAFWQTGDVQYCAVSDTGWDELLALKRLMRETAGP